MSLHGLQPPPPHARWPSPSKVPPAAEANNDVLSPPRLVVVLCYVPNQGPTVQIVVACTIHMSLGLAEGLSGFDMVHSHAQSCIPHVKANPGAVLRLRCEGG